MWAPAMTAAALVPSAQPLTYKAVSASRGALLTQNKFATANRGGDLVMNYAEVSFTCQDCNGAVSLVPEFESEASADASVVAACVDAPSDENDKKRKDGGCCPCCPADGCCCCTLGCGCHA